MREIQEVFIIVTSAGQKDKRCNFLKTFLANLETPFTSGKWRRNRKNERSFVCLRIVVSFVRVSSELQVVNARDQRGQSVVNRLFVASPAGVKNISQAGRT